VAELLKSVVETLLICAVVFLFIGAFRSWIAEPYTAELKQLKKEVEELRAERKNMDEALHRARKKIEEIQKRDEIEISDINTDSLIFLLTIDRAELAQWWAERQASKKNMHK
jgi:uncharacterized membrane protein